MNEEDKYIIGGVPKKLSIVSFVGPVPAKTFWMMIVWMLCSIPLLAVLILASFGLIIKVIILCIMIVWWVIFLKFFSSNKAIDRSFLYVRFLRRGFQGERVLSKFTQDVDHIKKFVPIKQIHEHGLIEYTDGSWVSCIDVVTPQITEDELPKHIAGIRGCIDSLYDDMSMLTRAISVMDIDTSYSQKILETAKQSFITTEQKAHLFDMDTHLREKSQHSKVWHISIILNFGSSDNLEDAQIKLAQTKDGYIDALRKAGDDATFLTTESVIYEQMRKMMLPMY